MALLQQMCTTQIRQKLIKVNNERFYGSPASQEGKHLFATF